MLEFQEQYKVYEKISLTVKSEIFTGDKIVGSNTSHDIFSSLNWIRMVNFVMFEK